MSFSFAASGISASGTDYISFTRFKIDDTESPGEISDEIIIALYGQTATGNDQITRNYHTAISAARYLQTKYTKQFNFSSAGTSVQQMQERAKAWGELIASLAYELASIQGAGPVVYPYRPAAYNDDCDNVKVRIIEHRW